MKTSETPALMNSRDESHNLGVDIPLDDVRASARIGSPAQEKKHIKSIPVLDGWRGVSILLVLATHMLPLGPKRWQLNSCAGPVGMSLFFTLSGFLITAGLLVNSDVSAFFIRRFCRILPLVYLYVTVVLLIEHKSVGYFIAHYLFAINYDFAYMTNLTGHLWSVCTEMHFYIFVGLLVLFAGRRGLYILPLLALAITGIRIYCGAHADIKTHVRVDEILAGATLALCYYHPVTRKSLHFLAITWLPFVLMVLLLVSGHPRSGSMNYARPYLAALLVGSTLWSSGTCLNRVLSGSILKYIATISYALYIIHPATMYGWLGAGNKIEKYLLKRPISFALTFIAAHISTFYYEKHWIRWGKMLAKRVERPHPTNVPLPALPN